MTVGQAFDRSVKYYDNWMKLALPSYTEIFSTSLEVIPFAVNEAIEVLDLGAGTGLFSQHVFTKYPHSRFVLYDLAPKLLEVARERFQPYQDQFEFIVKDYRDYQSARRFDLVISSLSIHHLTDADKAKLFSNIYHSLKDTGVFINVDQIKAPTPAMRKLYWDTWLAHVRSRGASEDQVQASIQRRTKYDQDALLVDQLRMLTDAGFTNVDCVYKNYFIGVFFASKEDN